MFFPVASLRAAFGFPDFFVHLQLFFPANVLGVVVRAGEATVEFTSARVEIL